MMVGESTSIPNLYVIAGPNGAGKTTFANDFLPDFVTCKEFLNADLMAAGLSPFAPETQSFRAGRLLLERIAELSKRRADFGFETTLAGRSYVKLLNDLKKLGYRVASFYLWLPSADAARQRVENRVKQGGHNVPAEDVLRRYTAGIKNLFQLYLPIADIWYLYDATELPPSLIAGEELHALSINQPSLFQQIKSQYGANDERS